MVESVPSRSRGRTKMNIARKIACGVVLPAVVALGAASAWAGEWTYDASANPKTISDGNWTIGLLDSDLENGMVQLGNITAGSGVLDLRNLTVDGHRITSILFHPNSGAYATSWKTWDISDFLIDAFDSVADDRHNTLVFGGNANIRNIEITGGNVASISIEFSGMTGLTNAVIRLPDLQTFGVYNQNSGFYNCTALKRVVLDCPKLSSMGQNVYGNCTALEGDVGDYIPPWVTNFWQNSQFTAAGVTGTLVLTNLQSVNYMNFSGIGDTKITFTGTSLAGSQIFRGRWGDVTLVAPDLTNMAFNASYVWTITNFTFYLPKLETAVGLGSSVKTTTFLSAAPAKSLVQTLVGNFTASSYGLDKIGTIYCSKDMGWQDVADAMTISEEMSPYKPEGCFGVVHSADGKTRAWLVHRNSPYQPQLGLSFSGDAITVTVPAGIISDTNRLALCWGEADQGEAFEYWDHTAILCDEVTSTGGVWTVSAAANGIAAGSVLRACLVKSYKVVEYAESTSNCKLAVNTRVEAKTGLHVKTKMRWLALGDIEFCGGRYKSGDHTRMYAVHTYQNKWLLGYGSTTASGSAIATGTDYEIESKLYLGSQTMVVDGVQTCSLSENYEVDTSGPCGVFAAWYPINQYTCETYTRCYYLKMWENGNTTDNPDGDLVRDFVPVKDADGHGALYDKVTGKVFESVYFGTGATEYLAVGDETGDEVSEMTVVGAAVCYNPAGTAGAGDFYATLDGRTLTITVNPAAVLNGNLALCLGSDAQDRGPDASDWAQVVVVADRVPYIGGVYCVNLTTAGITNDVVRPFLAQVTETEELTYLRMSNPYLNSHVRTGVPAKSGARVVTRMSWDNKASGGTGGDQSYFGAKASSADATRLMLIHCYPSQWGMGYVTGNWSKGAITNGKVCDVEVKGYVGYQMLKVDGSELYSGNNSTAIDLSLDFTVFACNYTEGNQGLGSVSTCYYLKVYSDGDETTNPDGTLVRDFVPARRGGKLGLWDKLNGEFHPGVGTCFSGGAVVSKLLPDTYETHLAANAIRASSPGLVLVVR